MSPSEKREHAALIAVNAAVIVAAETVGGGSYFYGKRLLEGVGLLFMLLPLIRVFTKSKVYDPTIVRIVQACLVALLIFTESTAFGFAGHYFFGLDGDTVQALIADFYLAGLLALIIGAEMVLGRISKRSPYIVWLPTLALLGLSGLNLAFALGVARPTLGVMSPLPLAYAVAVSVVAAFGFVSFNRLRGKLPLMRGFVDYIMAGAACIAASTIVTFFAFVLATALGLAAFQVAYFGSFFFLAAVSLMYLAFGKLGGFGGIYKDLQQAEADGDGPG
ncbi:MAG TPA: hypothetical protein VL426_06085 [Candidatus Binatia bacterium]|nr:hypothetical protein [Candidatus Binatia bacterium]